MAAQRVTGAIWWRMGKSHYQSLYRRARGAEAKQGFTRDFLQASGVRSVLLEMFGREPPYDLTYVWPGGSYANGRIYPAADYDDNGRVDVGQFIGGVPPLPWQIGDPGAVPEITLPGDPDAPIPGAANDQWENRIKPLGPWLMLVQLEGNRHEAHIRAYLEHPVSGLEQASLTRVPEALRNLMTARSRVGAGAAAAHLPELWFDPESLRDPWQTTAAVSGSQPPAPGPGTGAAEFGVRYWPGDEQVQAAAPEPFSIDPDERDRSTRAHHETQNALAAIVRARGLMPRSPDGEPNFDIGWEEENGRLVVVEVKSVSERNVEKQLRLGLGQVLRYRNILASRHADVAAVLAISSPPRDRRWVGLCDELGVGLIWRPDLEAMLTDWLD